MVEVPYPFRVERSHTADITYLYCMLKDGGEIRFSITSIEQLHLGVSPQEWVDKMVAQIRTEYDVAEEPSMHPKLKDKLNNSVGESWEDIIIRRGGRYLKNCSECGKANQNLYRGVCGSCLTGAHMAHLERLEKEQEKEQTLAPLTAGRCHICGENGNFRKKGRTYCEACVEIETKLFKCAVCDLITNPATSIGNLCKSCATQAPYCKHCHQFTAVLPDGFCNTDCRKLYYEHIEKNKASISPANSSPNVTYSNGVWTVSELAPASTDVLRTATMPTTTTNNSGMANQSSSGSVGIRYDVREDEKVGKCCVCHKHTRVYGGVDPICSLCMQSYHGPLPPTRC